MQDNVVTVNGERARLFGAEALYEYQPLVPPVANLESDVYHRFVIDSDHARAVHEGADENTRAMLRGYLAGLNQYFTSTPSEQIDPACRAYARLLTDTDLYRVITDRVTRAGSVAFLEQLAVAPTPPAVTTASRRATRVLARSKPVVPQFTWLGFGSAQPSKVALFSVGANIGSTRRQIGASSVWKIHGAPSIW